MFGSGVRVAAIVLSVSALTATSVLADPPQKKGGGGPAPAARPAAPPRPSGQPPQAARPAVQAPAPVAAVPTSVPESTPAPAAADHQNHSV